MSERMPWFRCVPSALLGALAGMRADEGYVYVVVLMRIYETGGPVAETSRTLSRRTGLAERRVTEAVRFLTETSKLHILPDGRLDSSSTHDEIHWQTERRKDQSKAGKASKSKKNGSFFVADGKSDAEKPQQNQQSEPTSVQQPSNHIDLEVEVEKENKSSEADASGEVAVLAAPVIDPTKAVRDRLWLDGPAALVGMGQREGMARSLIGRWLKMTGDDPGRVHSAIEEAQRSGTGDPVPYIARVLSDRPPTRASPQRTSFGQRSQEAVGRMAGIGNGKPYDDDFSGPTLEARSSGGEPDFFDVQPRGCG
jgi:uncharacterized protein YdaU (DUF1376 family)